MITPIPTDFAPTDYARLIKIISYPASGFVEFHIDADGLEDPNAKIVPIIQRIGKRGPECVMLHENRLYTGDLLLTRYPELTVTIVRVWN